MHGLKTFLQQFRNKDGTPSKSRRGKGESESVVTWDTASISSRSSKVSLTSHPSPRPSTSSLYSPPCREFDDASTVRALEKDDWVAFPSRRECDNSTISSAKKDHDDWTLEPSRNGDDDWTTTSTKQERSTTGDEKIFTDSKENHGDSATLLSKENVIVAEPTELDSFAELLQKGLESKTQMESKKRSVKNPSKLREMKRKEGIEKVINMMENGTPISGFRLFRPVSRSSRKSGIVTGESMRCMDSIIDVCDSMDHSSIDGTASLVAGERHSRAYLENETESVESESVQSQSTEQFSTEATASDSDEGNSSSVEGQVEYGTETHCESHTVVAQEATDKTIYSIQEVAESTTDTSDEDGSRSCRRTPSDEDILPVPRTRLSLAPILEDCTDMSQLNLTSSPSGISTDSWGQDQSQNLPPIARLRYMHACNDDTVPYYY